MPRRTRPKGSKQQRKRAVPKVRRYRIPRLSVRLINECHIEPTADRVKYAAGLKAKTPLGSAGGAL